MRPESIAKEVVARVVVTHKALCKESMLGNCCVVVWEKRMVYDRALVVMKATAFGLRGLQTKDGVRHFSMMVIGGMGHSVFSLH